ncbi:MAG: hypothetical protein A2637_03860 [Candidatus Muproteobacteria bacterium RIFCSPHIGHO2_01_FULL_65_16]|uniref:DUF2914 domain-containing protein n=3 Tax=Candidatus Muproteobacteria TaxID=1817795 RepID=A0A1F6TD30_9PROT|nr:MAG: hypothetical protein A2V92_01560 [Candidatus Muproteobacteria bacterium RBG_16_65_31]OGI45082.1 MAG: hypothetical protein A2637_03860 [Candidatus Muproteobacteria bacterium RIFCSPHIGHO2_01_FULL_65_16]OGI53066.1 MAG: hypothetical protein A3B81_07485 [Candidatus Muproteobacteria bacterium RIFCSPHIGHO2_02_FULL_65_16]
MNKTLITLAGLLASLPALAADPAPATPAAPAAAPATAPAAPVVVTGTVARAVVASGISDREPTDNLTTVSNDVTKVYFFTELKDMAGQSVTHRWEFDGKTMYEMKFDVAGARWRVFSSKTLDPSWTGAWKVSVVDANGGIMKSGAFTYTKAPAPAPAAPAAAPVAPAAPAPAK